MTTRLRLRPLDLRKDGLGGFAELDFRRLEHRELVVRLQLVLGGNRLQDVDAVERPAVRLGDGGQLGLGLGERDVKAHFARAGTREGSGGRESSSRRRIPSTR